MKRVIAQQHNVGIIWVLMSSGRDIARQMRDITITPRQHHFLFHYLVTDV